MKYTNKHNLPSEIIRAVENDQYTKGDSIISVTGLLNPPRIRMLQSIHGHEITSDYSDEIWKLLGQGVHAILERANENYDDTITEQRLYQEVKGWRISGQTDSLSLKDNTLRDYKITSVWTIINALSEGKSEWNEQLNSYAWLYHKNTGKTVDGLEIIAIARDWNKRELQRRGGDYPEVAISIIKIPLWSLEEQEIFLQEKVSIHQAVEADYIFKQELPLCTDEERWKKPDTYRVMKKGRKTAVRVFKTEEEAERYRGNMPVGDTFWIEFSKGESMRCNYCNVSDFCSQYQSEVKNG